MTTTDHINQLRVNDPTSAAQHLAANPLSNACAGRRLVAFLRACGKARNDQHINSVLCVTEPFLFWTSTGEPDLQAARHFAERLRDLHMVDESYGHRIGIRHMYNRVTVRLIPIDEIDATDAVRAPVLLDANTGAPR